MDIGTYLSPTQAAVRLGCSPQRIAALIERGELAAVKTAIGRLIDPESVDEVIARRAARAAGAVRPGNGHR